MIGSTLAHFEITAKLGEGGMGAVYRATDSKLGREVAIKVLPEAVTSDPERLARFEREAKVLAALKHPAIATVHEVGEEDGVHYLVMELAAGEPLDVRLSRGTPTLAEARAIALQIARALEHAHENGIVHRDLKPANVHVSESGEVKVLDFGLARIFKAEPGPPPADLTRSPTMSYRATRAGVLMGTAAYMSPEQARGERVDRRSDIWAFGALLFEMLTGRPLFRGETLSDILADVLRAEIDWKALPATPPAVRRLLRRCLERSPEKRLQWIGDARLELEESEESGPREEKAPGGWSRSRLPWALVAVLGAVTLWRFASEDGVPSAADVPGGSELATTWSIPPPQGSSFVTTSGPPAIAPDGEKIAFVARRGDEPRYLYLRRLDVAEPVRLSGTEGAEHPFWSHDSRALGFLADGQLKRLDPSTGSVSPIARLETFVGQASWSRDGSIMLSRWDARALLWIQPDGEQVELQLPEQGDEWLVSPVFLPDGEHYLFSVQNIAGGREDGIYLGSTAAPGSRLIAPVNSSALLSSSGDLLVWRSGGLRHQRFDLQTLSLLGEPRLLVDGVAFSPLDVTAYASVQDEVLVYMPGEPIWPGQLSLVDRRGTPIATIGPTADYYVPRLSPDGRRVIVDVTAVQPAGGDIWSFDTRTGAALRLTSDPLNESNPIWSADGEELIFHRGPDLYRLSSRGTGEARLLLRQDAPLEASDWSADGRVVIYNRGMGTELDIWRLDVESGATRPLLASPFLEEEGRLSPDGRFMVYQSNESGQFEVYVVDLPEQKRKRSISMGEGLGPVWTRGGTEVLFYSATRQAILSIEVRLGDELVTSPPVVLFPVVLKHYESEAQFHASADGELLILNRLVESHSEEPLVVRTRWRSRLGG